MSNHDKKYTPPKKRATPRKASAGAEALARSDATKAAEVEEQRRGDVIPSPVPYDRDELGSGRGLTYEWEYWIEQLQLQITSLQNSGGGGSGGGGSAVYVHTQSSATSVWMISHSLGTKPNVLVLDNAGQQLLAEVTFPSNSLVTVTHAAPYAGVAYLRA